MAALPVSPLPVPESPQPLSEGARILNTFIAPSKTFTDLRRSAAWWGPFLVLAVVAVLFAYAVDTKVGFAQAVENQIQHSPRATRQMEGLSPEARAQAIHGRAVGSRYVMYAFPLFTLILFAIFAGIYFATFKFGANADITFGRAFAVVAYAALPEAIRGVLAAVTLFAGAAADSFNMQNPVATNAAYFMDPNTSPFIYGIASSLDVFRLWSLVLTAIGFAYAGKVKLGTAFAIVLGWFVLVTLIFSGLGTMGG